MRGQANLPALAVALLALTGTMIVGLAIADGAFESADRRATDRQTAVGISELLVDPGGPLADRANVLNASAVESFDADALRAAVPGLDGRDVKVALDDEPVASTGDVSGPTIERLVLVERRQRVATTPELDGRGTVTLPRRTDRVDVRIDPAAEATVTALRVEDRVVRRNESGLAGEHEVATSRYETVTLSIEADGPLSTGDVELTYYPTRTETSLLAVSVDG